MTSAGTAATSDGGNPTPTAPDWPTDRCDGANPMTGSPCINGHHKGYHRDILGAEWLDD
ncbi:hypothetical protein ACI2LF_04505 [Kribbella sp. NPDC020789]